MAKLQPGATPQATSSVSAGLSIQTFAAFSSRPFLLLWLNNFSFMLVNGIQRFAFVWLALELSGASFVLGAVSFALGVPILLFSLPAGVLIDRIDRRLILVGSQVFGLAGSLAAAVFIWSGLMSVTLTFVFAATLGVAIAVGQPARQAIIPSIVRPERLMNAVTLTGLTQNLSQLGGPAIGGFSIALWGVGGSFAAQAVLLSLGLIALIPLAIPRPAAAADIKRRIGDEIAEGIRFVLRERDVRVLIFLLMASAIATGGPWGALLPKIAKEELGAGAFQASMLFAIMGIGTLLSSLWLASIPSLRNAGGWFLITLMIGSSIMIGIGLSNVYLLTLTFMFASGFNAGFFMNLNMTLVQAYSPPKVMGRVMSIHTLGFMGGMPLGALIGGFGAGFIGAPAYFVACGAVNVGLAIVAIFTQPSMRRMHTLGPAEAAAQSA